MPYELALSIVGGAASWELRELIERIPPGRQLAIAALTVLRYRSRRRRR